MSHYSISKHGYPKEFTACPGCGHQIGHHRTKFCMACEQCSKCCDCGEKQKDIKPASEGIQFFINRCLGGE